MNCKLKYGGCAADIIVVMQKSCFHTVASSALLLVLLCAAEKLCWAKASWRVLEFSPNYSVGRLVVLKTGLESYGRCKGKLLAEARGLIKLPSDKLIKFEPSAAFYRHPQCLLKLPANAFDFIELRFMAMTDEESSLSDPTIPFVRRISGLKGIDIEGSEITDKGLSQLGAMPELRYLAAGNGFITGSCLPHLIGCKKLESLRFGGTLVNNDYLRYLQNFPCLRQLGLTNVNLSLSGLEHVSKCRAINNLDIDANYQIDDKALPLMLKLTNLRTLSLKGTKISLKALETLGKHGIISIGLPKPFASYSPGEQRRLLKAFPYYRFSAKPTGDVDSYNETMFAPITR
ncbi:MAG: hypothetical protein QG574_3572 [Cyanobacteriota bacterium erpe_2018_sw_21hr_WHONDRS-SW48-000092_B_bin.40]|nr:hypothetical protein [Cyanobacteriota bacterium erpe_2018_sw_21hr_WHONDRS-SW48-000092_B_bin.40]